MVRLTNEIKTGVVVVVAALLLLFLVYKIGGIKTEKGYEVKCTFTYVSGLEENAPVKLAGVKIGEVKSVGHSYDGDETRVLVTLKLDEKARIREDSKIRISTTGLIGEKYIEIAGGSKGSPFIKKGAILVGIDPFEIEELIETGRTLAARIDSGVQDLQKLVGHADGVLVDNKDDIRATIVNLKDTSENFKEFSDDIRRNPWKLIMKQKEVSKAAPKKK
ncbi:MAG: MlaD family protein [Candidatus Omnitrophota bacterium]|nr:MlaD family protein [Candidatus Omnitrophota bacterium]MDP3787419.1 MlaD family protein [Candidatus Omnitrophota bacterium]